MFVKHEYNWDYNHHHRYVRILSRNYICYTQVLDQVPQTQNEKIGVWKVTGYLSVCLFAYSQAL